MPDWTTEVCRSGMCFNGEPDCREACARICREQGGRGFCYFDNFLSRVFICWCGFDLPETSTVAAVTAPSTIISTLTPTTGTIELNGIAFYLKEWKLVLRTIIAILFPPLKCATIKNAKIQWYLFTYLPNTICCEEIGLEIK